MEPWYLTRPNRGVLIRRVFVSVLLLDLAAMVVFAGNISGNLTSGLYWPSPGMVLFPVPLDLRTAIELPMLTPLSPVDQFGFLFFVSNGVWIAWTAVAMAYISYPVFRRLMSRHS